MILPDNSSDFISRENYNHAVEEIAKIARLFSERNWFLGTSGNISFKISSSLHMAITASGIDKGNISENSFVTLDADGKPTQFSQYKTTQKASHEYPIHHAIYEKKSAANFIFHIHSLNAVLFADTAKSNSRCLIENLEVLKGLGFRTYRSKTYLPILENNDDPSQVASAIKKITNDTFQELPAFLIKDHGIFVWGDSVFAARRHVELLDHVFAILLHRQKKVL